MKFNTSNADLIEHNITVRFMDVVTLPTVDREAAVYIGTSVFQDSRDREDYLAELVNLIITAPDTLARTKKALTFAGAFGNVDGDHHKMWVIDQMVRALLGDKYKAWVKDQKDGVDGPETYSWEEGIAP